MKIMLVTDAWEPQVNGVVRTLARTMAEVRAMGHEIEVVSPIDGYKTIPLITYSEIKLAFGAKRPQYFHATKHLVFATGWRRFQQIHRW